MGRPFWKILEKKQNKKKAKLITGDHRTCRLSTPRAEMSSKYFRNTPVWVPTDRRGYVPAAIKIILDGVSVRIQKSNLIKEVDIGTDALVPIEDLYVGLPAKIFQKSAMDKAFRKLAESAMGRWTVPLDKTLDRANENKSPYQSGFLRAAVTTEPSFQLYQDNAEEDETDPGEDKYQIGGDTDIEIKEFQLDGDDDIKLKEDEIDGHSDIELNKDHEEERKNTIKQFLCDLDDSDDEEQQLAKKNKGAPQPLIKKPEQPTMSEYERIQQKNIEDRRKMFKELMMSDAKKSTEIPKKTKPVVRAVRRRTVVDAYSTRSEPIRLRNRNVSGSHLLSGLVTPTKRFLEEDELSGEETRAKRSRRVQSTRSSYKDPNTDVPTPDDISEKMLENVADAVSQKVYNREVGTSCHQCRQKTLDTKTICRSGFCVGVRGAFCGVCLLNRYGEKARVALKDPEWACPPCNNRCNCSICRNRAGKGATGILTYEAQEKGYNNVADYLEAIRTSLKDKGNVAE